ncbi:calcium-binding protein [Microvirga terricola]|nr:calcium-binding protein [Microvirga terricola]
MRFILDTNELNFTIPVTLPGGGATPPDMGIIGNARDNILTGDATYNWFNGGLGTDRLIGGRGDDTYVLDADANDVIVEGFDEGIDRVFSMFSYTLPENVENLELTGTANINGFGNGEDNNITGNSGNNILFGGAAGFDDLFGDSGNDTIIAHSGDSRLGGGEGIDVVSYALLESGVEVHFDSLFARTGSGGQQSLFSIENAIGTAFSDDLNGDDSNNLFQAGAGNDKLAGGWGNDTLDGGAGIDDMYGGVGDDVYVVDNVADLVREWRGEGFDTVITTASFSLGAADVEILQASGKAAISLTGNGIDNTIVGNTANNKLSGGLGNDTLKGELGNDTLTGGKGKDVFTFDAKLNKSKNVDKITDFNAKDDTIYLSKSIFSKISKKGTLKASMFKIGDAAADKDDRIIFNKKTGSLSYDADGSGKGAAVEFARIDKKVALTFKDFYIV